MGVIVKNLSVTSPAFKNKEKLPVKYTCDGKGVNPSLVVDDIPSEAETLVLIVEDPDAPSGRFDHWIVWNIPTDEKIEENSVPGLEGLNNSGKTNYSSPCPPSGTHRYVFKVYALDAKIDLQAGSGRKELEEAIKNHIVAKGEMVGLYR